MLNTVSRIAVVAAIALMPLPVLAAHPTYQKVIIDPNPIGHDTVEKTFADIRGTGKLSVVVGDALGGGLWWYGQPAFPTTTPWPRYEIAAGSYYEDIVPHDVNRDGAVDLIASDSGNHQLVWFENPRGSGRDPTQPWTRHVIASGAAHVIQLADLDGDGKMDIVTSSSGLGGTVDQFIFQNAPTSWRVVPSPHFGAGIAMLDIGSGKGAINVVSGDGNNVVWWENPREHGGNARTGTWIEHVVGSVPVTGASGNSFTAWIKDIVGRASGAGAAGNSFATGVFSSSGRMDILTTENEGTTDPGIYRFVAPADRRNGTWVRQTVAPDYQAVHRMAVGDMDKDGNLDFVAAEQEQSNNKRVTVFYNDGNGNFTPQVLATTGGHNVQVGDVTGDGDLDILNENHGYTGAPNPVEVWLNQLNNAVSTRISLRPK